MTKSNSIAKSTAAFILGAAILVAGLSGCNTVEGAGQDIKSTGKAIERTADDSK